MSSDEDRFAQVIGALNAGLAVLPEFHQLLEERRRQGEMSTQEILGRAGARFDENQLALLEDLARLMGDGTTGR